MTKSMNTNDPQTEGTSPNDSRQTSSGCVREPAPLAAGAAREQTAQPLNALEPSAATDRSGRSGAGGVAPLYFQELFDYMMQEHGLTLLGEEMHEIAIICARRAAQDRREEALRNEASASDAERRLETARLNYEPRVEALDWMEQMLIHCPDAIVRYNEDPDVEDRLGMVPVGFSIRGDGCQGSFCVVDDSLLAVLLRDKAQVAILNNGRAEASVAWRAAAAGESPSPIAL